MHLAMYRARNNARAVVHVHPTYAIAFSTLIGEESANAVPPYTAAFYVRAGRVPMIPYHASGAHSLHEAVARWRRRHHAILLRQHGSSSPAPTCRLRSVSWRRSSSAARLPS